MLTVKRRIEQLEAYRGRSDAIAYVVLHSHAAQVRCWSGRTEWLTLEAALPLLNDPSIKFYEASDSFDPEGI